MLTNDELQALQAIILNPTSTNEARRDAELKFDQFQNVPDAWKVHISLLQSANANTVFLLCFGLNKIIWKIWNNIDREQQSFIAQSIITYLVSKFDILPSYVRSKVEQLLATICKNNVSYDILYEIIKYAEQSPRGPIIGISASRTILEEVLSLDSRLSPEKRTYLTNTASTMATQLLNTACSICVSTIQMESNDLEILQISVDLIKVIITKIPIGNHINHDILKLLFSIAELGAKQEKYTQVSLIAVETLTEFMSKKYIPGGNNNETVANILLDIVAKAMNLVRIYSAIPDLNESPIILVLLQFISTFSESHIERCLSSGNNHVLHQIILFLRELSTLTCASNEPEYLLRIAEMWDNLLRLDLLKEQLLYTESATVCLPVIKHLIINSTLQYNPLLFEMLDELEEDYPIEAYTDTHIKDLISHLGDEDTSRLSTAATSSSNGNMSMSTTKSTSPDIYKKAGMEGELEDSCHGTTLRSIVVTASVEFIQSPDARAWLQETIPNLVQHSIQLLGDVNTPSNNKKGVALDLCYYVRLLPLCVPPMELLSKLCPLLMQLVESRLYSYGKAYMAIQICCIEVIGQLIQSFGRSTPRRTVTSLTTPNIEAIDEYILMILNVVKIACDTKISPSPYAVMTSSCALLLQCLTALQEYYQDTNNTSKPKLQEVFSMYLLPNLSLLPLEIHALLICSADQIFPEISPKLTTDLKDLSVYIVQSSNPIDIFMDNANVNLLCRYSACMDALARHYSILTPTERQKFIRIVTPLQEILGPLTTSCINALSHIATQLTSNTTTTTAFNPASILSKFHSILHISRLVISLICGLQQSLGKKHFGNSSVEALNISVTMLHSNIGNLIVTNISCIKFIKQLLVLTNVIASSSSAMASSAAYQVSLTEKLLSYICTHLTNPDICAELLSDTIKTGTMAVSSYWGQKASTILNTQFNNTLNSKTTTTAKPILHINLASSGLATTDDSMPNVTSAPTICCLPIVKIVTQLFVGSLNPHIAPQDATIAIDGYKQLIELHNIFSIDWYQQSGCWIQLLTGCIQCLLHISQPLLIDNITDILIELQKSEIQIKNELPWSQGYWMILSQQTYQVATEINIHETATRLLNELLLKYPNNCHGLDMNIYMNEIIHPLIAESSILKS